MAEAKRELAQPGAPRTSGRRRKKAGSEPSSRGLEARALGGEGAPSPPADVRALAAAIEGDGGRVLACFREPLGGHWQVLAGLPVERVRPTPFQRDLSETHVERLASVMERIDRFLDPVIAVRRGDGTYWTPNGHHRTAAVKRLGGRAIVALVLLEEKVAYQILALNTEKAHNLREKALEVIRMARALAEPGTRAAAEKDFALEFEEPALLTLGICYEKRPRLAGGSVHLVLRRVDEFLDEPIARALEIREGRAVRVLALDDAVADAVARLRERGFESPYLKAFVVARVNPLRFKRGGGKADFDETFEKMTAAARKLDPGKVRPEQLAQASGPPEES